ncbi:TonB-dependent receptor [Gilvimarinus algae]|uniref:TonB-dependent receptor n=1 Tax=Gilvimarinus algae TaxID=3058037 RepID=A0ABT8TIM2_9GAMM|nr:TonB-dependent receptor [Gilvimarinus sp. SDUM040014]MDO3382933.1 TonB-dependent receptor [Gilvimarinus sp. SDUM040014]
MQFSKKLLSLAVCAATTGLTLPAAYAQEDNGEELVEEVVVRGMRVSVQNAQDIKRNADTIKDVVTASDIGALPDKSVTEALQRVPGVTIERFASSDDPNHFADEGTGVLVRGLDRVRSEINGRGAFSANPWGGLNYEDFSPELLGAVEVTKNQTADMSAGGIAGTVNLITRKPFDSPDMMFGATVKGNYGDFREEWSPTASALFSDRWETSAGEFGFLISGSYSELLTRGDGVGVANFYSRGDSFIGDYLGWGPVASIDPESPVDGPAIGGQEPGTVVWVPGQYSMRTAENDREREGLATSLQWQNTDETVIATLEYIRSDASLTWRERVVGAQAQGFDRAPRSHPAYYGTEEYPMSFDENNFFEQGVYRYVEDSILQMSSRYNYNKNTVEDASFNLELRPNDDLTIELDYQRVDSTNKVENYGINARTLYAYTDTYVDLTGDTPTFEFLNDAFFDQAVSQNWEGKDQHSHLLGSALDQNVDSDATSDRFALDLDYQISDGWARSVKVGVEYSDKDLTIRDTEYSNWGALNYSYVPEATVAGSALTNPDEFETVNFDDFYDGSALLGRTEILFPRMSNAENFTDFVRRGCEQGFNTANYGGAGGENPGQNNPNCYLAQADLGDRIPGTVYAPHQITGSNEERAEAYARFDFAFDDWAVPVRGNVGLRYVSYKLESSGFTNLPDRPTTDGQGADVGAIFADTYPDAYEWADGEGQATTVKGTDYSTVLPSLNLAANLTEDLILRFGLSKGLYFPGLQDTRNSKVISMSFDSIRETQDGPVTAVTNLQISGIARNPNLQPEEAINTDLSLEWYFADAGSLSMAVFNKDIDHLFRERSFIEEVPNVRNGTAQTVTFTGPANEGSGSIRGFELSYSQFYDFLPGILSGLGLQMNYTYIDQDDLNDKVDGSQVGQIRYDTGGNPIYDDRANFRAFSNLPLPGYSDENYNIIGMYEYADISARVAYTWRSEFMVTRRDSNEFAPVYQTDYGQLDASIFYNITDNIKVGLEGTNLTNEVTTTEVQYNQEGDRTQSLNFLTDRRYAVSLQVTF